MTEAVHRVRIAKVTVKGYVPGFKGLALVRENGQRGEAFFVRAAIRQWTRI